MVLKSPSKVHPMSDAYTDWLVIMPMLDKGEELTVETVESWTQEQRDEAVQWASANWFRASDNAYVRVPPKPDFLIEVTA